MVLDLGAVTHAYTYTLLRVFGDWGKAHRVKGLQEGSQSLEYRAWGVGAQASASPAF